MTIDELFLSDSTLREAETPVVPVSCQLLSISPSPHTVHGKGPPSRFLSCLPRTCQTVSPPPPPSLLTWQLFHCSADPSGGYSNYALIRTPKLGYTGFGLSPVPSVSGVQLESIVNLLRLQLAGPGLISLLALTLDGSFSEALSPSTPLSQFVENPLLNEIDFLPWTASSQS